MKLTTKLNVKEAKSGMTLLELTVVILVLLSLISILFIGARAWKKGSDRAASILQIRNTQQAVRSFSNMNGLNPGDQAAAITAKGFGALDAEIFGTGKFIENDPRVAGGHPAGSGYLYTTLNAGNIPAFGTLYLTVIGSDPTDPTAGSPADYMPQGYNPSNPATNTVNDW